MTKKKVYPPEFKAKIVRELVEGVVMSSELMFASIRSVGGCSSRILYGYCR